MPETILSYEVKQYSGEPISGNSANDIVMPQGAVLLSADHLRGVPYVFVLGDPQAEHEPRAVAWIGTDEKPPKGWEFIDTFVVRIGKQEIPAVVGHVFDGGEVE